MAEERSEPGIKIKSLKYHLLIQKSYCIHELPVAHDPHKIKPAQAGEALNSLWLETRCQMVPYGCGKSAFIRSVVLGRLTVLQ